MTVKSTSVNKTVNKTGNSETKARPSPAPENLIASADRARETFQYQEANELYTRAIESGELDAAREFDARQARCIMRIDKLESRKADARQMVRLARALKDPVREIRAHIEEIKASDESDAEVASRRAQTALKQARQRHNLALEAEATFALGLTYFLKYDYQTAAQVAMKSLE